MDEQVLVVPAERLAAAGEFHGLRPFTEDFRRLLLDAQYLSFRPRAEVETDPSFKQLIPYVVLRCGGGLFHYTRGSQGTEARLRALRAVGIGGGIFQGGAGAGARPPPGGGVGGAGAGGGDQRAGGREEVGGPF